MTSGKKKLFLLAYIAGSCAAIYFAYNGRIQLGFTIVVVLMSLVAVAFRYESIKSDKELDLENSFDYPVRMGLRNITIDVMAVELYQPESLVFELYEFPQLLYPGKPERYVVLLEIQGLDLTDDQLSSVDMDSVGPEGFEVRILDQGSIKVRCGYSVDSKMTKIDKIERIHYHVREDTKGVIQDLRVKIYENRTDPEEFVDNR